MKVLSVPVRLRFATGLLALCIPIAALETILVIRAPWWQIPYRTVTLWCAAVGCIVLPLGYWILSAKRWALRLTGLFAVAWCLLTLWVSYRAQSTSLGFFSLFLIFYWSSLYFWIRHEMSRSFFDPRMQWYEGLPQAIPGLVCELNQGDVKSLLKVSRIDGEGTFVFSDKPLTFRLHPSQEAEMIFSYKDRQARCRGIAVGALEKDQGLGIEFRGMTFDSRKDLGDFLETLRGEGHV